MPPSFHTHIQANGVAWLTLARPERHNAFDDSLIAALTLELQALDQNTAARLLVLAGEGASFSAGADINWMRRIADYSEAENVADATALATLMRQLDLMRIPTIARIHGPAFGGGVGLVACCDIGIATTDAVFCLSEVKLGLIPAVISPYVISKIGQGAARRYFLTAEKFSAEEARRLGLVHQTVAPSSLDAVIDQVCHALLANSPAALTAAKQLIRDVTHHAVDDSLIALTASRIAKIRGSAEGKEGLAAFLGKRSPSWINPEDDHSGIAARDASQTKKPIGY